MTAAARRRSRRTAEERKLLEQQAISLKVGGATYPQISEQLGVSLSTAHAMVTRVLQHYAELTDRDAAIELPLALTTVDRLASKAWAVLARPGATPEQILAAIDRLLRCEKRRAQLLGTDAPKRVVHTGPDGGPIEHQHTTESELDHEIRRLMGDLAAREQACIPLGHAELPPGFEPPLRLDAGPEAD